MCIVGRPNRWNVNFTYLSNLKSQVHFPTTVIKNAPCVGCSIEITEYKELYRKSKSHAANELYRIDMLLYLSDDFGAGNSMILLQSQVSE